MYFPATRSTSPVALTIAERSLIAAGFPGDTFTFLLATRRWTHPSVPSVSNHPSRRLDYSPETVLTGKACPYGGLPQWITFAPIGNGLRPLSPGDICLDVPNAR